MSKTRNHIQRRAAINNFLVQFVNTDPTSSECGQRQGNQTLQNMYEHVRAMEVMGNGVKWRSGVRDAVLVVEQAMTLFAKAMDDFSYTWASREVVVLNTSNYTPDTLGPMALQDFDRIVVWAAFQASTYLSIGNGK